MKLIIDISEEDYKRCTVMASAIRNGIPLDDVKAEIEKHQFSREYCCDHNIDTAIDMGMVRIILDKSDFPQAEDIEPTVKSFSKVLSNKLISNAIEEERCCICGGVKRFGICQNCGTDM